MRDIERRLYAAQRSLVFAEATVGDFVALHTELDPRTKHSKIRTCGNVIKKIDDVLHIKIHGSSDIVTIRRGDPKAVSFDLPRMHQSSNLSSSTHRVIIDNEVLYIITICESGAVSIRDGKHKLLFEFTAIRALPIGVEGVIFELNSNIYLTVSKSMHIVKSAITDVKAESGTIYYKKHKSDGWNVPKKSIFDAWVQLSYDEQLNINTHINSFITK